MATLTATGIIFNDSTTLDSKYGIIPQTNTPVIFFQASAPSGWTRQTLHNDKILRVVSTGGGTSGGTNAFTNTLNSKPVSANVPVTINGLASGSTTLDINTIPSHAHPANSGGNIGVGAATPSFPGAFTGVAPGSSTGNYGNSGSHAHGVSFTSANGPLSTTLDFRVQYIVVIYCTFD
jgi:hypothetical protein